MHGSNRRSVEVFHVHPLTLVATLFLTFLLQSVIPLTFPQARLFDFPLVVTIYFSFSRRSKVFGTGLGAVVGLLQDALSRHYLGLYGMAKALVGYLAASASVKFELEGLLPRFLLTAVLVFVHNLFLSALEHALLQFPPAFMPVDLASGVLFNIALALVVFQVLDRFRRPA
jgi:rod shape-determining protein MreD